MRPLFTRYPKLMAYNKALNYADMRALAQRRLPRSIFEYIDRGTEDELGLIANRVAWDSIKLNPSVLNDVSDRRQDIELFGSRQSMPVVIAPTAMAGVVYPDGEVELAKAAAASGVPICISTQSVTAIEKIAAEAGGRLWFQLYVWRDRSLTSALVERVRAAGAEALIITVDTPVPAKREYNVRNGFPFGRAPRNLADILLHPRWLLQTLPLILQIRRNGGKFPHYPTERPSTVGPTPGAERLELADSLNWDDIAMLRRQWTGPLIIKGILRVDDAQRALAAGVDGIVVSNHGGRNLDMARATADVLPEIADAVGDRLTVMVDSGIQRGSDVIKAVALGAKAVLVGRATLYGTAAGGVAGASRMLSILRSETDRTMAMIGKVDITHIGRDAVHQCRGARSELDLYQEPNEVKRSSWQLREHRRDML
jgi:(S)-mandelate dehydrogenase